MAILTVTEFNPTGVAAAPVAAAGGGDSFPNDGKTYFEITNGDASSKTITFAVTETVDGDLNVPDRTVTVLAGARTRVGPFRPSRYNDANERVAVSYSAVTSVTVEAFKVE